MPLHAPEEAAPTPPADPCAQRRARDPVTRALIECFGHDVGMAIDERRALTFGLECRDVALSSRRLGTVCQPPGVRLEQHVFFEIADSAIRVEVDFFFATHAFGERLHSIGVTTADAASCRGWHSTSEAFRLAIGDHTFVCGPGTRLEELWTRPALLRCLRQCCT